MPAGVMIPSFQIDHIPVTPGLVLAPMSGVTDSPFRRLVQKASGDAVGLVMSVFIHVGCLTRKTMFSMIKMAFHPSERPVAIQIYGADPSLIADAARMEMVQSDLSRETAYAMPEMQGLFSHQC